MNVLCMNWLVASISAGSFVGIGVLVCGVILCAKQPQWLKGIINNTAKWTFSFNGVFWMANVACMAYSAQNAGYIFGLYEWTGYAVGIIIDLLIIVFTQLMMTAKARGERDRASKILLFIILCCVLSLTGNVAHNLHLASTTKNGLSGVWFEQLIPYVASIMPLFLTALAWVKDLKVDPLEFEDPKKYAEAEQKRLSFVRTQVRSRQERVALETQIIAVEKQEKQNKLLRKGKLPKSFRWPWEQPLAIETILAELSTQIQSTYEVQITELEEKVLQLESGQEQEDQQKVVESSAQPSVNLSQNQGGNFDQTSVKVASEDVSTFSQGSQKVSPNVLPENPETLEKDTDPTLQNIPSNIDQTSELSFMKDQSKVEANFPKTSEPTTGKLSRQSSQILSTKSAKVSGKVTRRLSPELLKTFENTQEEVEIANRNAITKAEAATYLNCELKDIESAIRRGQLRMYGNSKDKVLVSSLKDFTPAKRRRMRVVA